jgi:hypothetical protein
MEEGVQRPDVSKRLKENKTFRRSVVKCCLKGNLENPEVNLPFINDLVESVSKCSRFGALLFNAVLLDVLETHEGLLPPELNLSDTKVLNSTVRNCIINNTRNTIMEATLNKFRSVFDKILPIRLQGDFNALTYASNTYVTNFKNHIIENMEDRILSLLKAYIYKNELKLPKGTRYLALRHVIGTSTKPFDEKVPSEFQDVVKTWRDAFKARSDGLNGNIEFIYSILVQVKLWGGKTFVMAPLTSQKRHFVTIDKTVFWSYFYNNRFVEANIVKDKVNLKDEGFMEDEDRYKDQLFTVFKSKIQNLMSAKQGWIFSRTIQTDGYALVVNFINMRQLKAKKMKKQDTMIKLTGEEHVVGIDPGLVNIYYAVSPDFPKDLKFTRTQYYMQGKIKASIKMSERWNGEVKDVLEMLSFTTFKTPFLTEFMEYVKVCADNNDRLWNCLGALKRNRNNMSTYIHKIKAIDKFLVKLGSKTKETVVAYGAAKFNCSCTGAVPVPTVTAYKMCKKHYKTVLVDEFRTSKMCCHCDEELLIPSRRVAYTNKAGELKTRKVETRGVRWCQSTKCLESHKLDPKVPAVVRYSRDSVGALNILRCLGKPNNARPKALQRKEK